MRWQQDMRAVSWGIAKGVQQAQNIIILDWVSGSGAMLTTTRRTQVFFVFITVVIRLIILVIILVILLALGRMDTSDTALTLTKAENEAVLCIAPLQNLQHNCPGPPMQPTKLLFILHPRDPATISRVGWFWTVAI